MERSAEFVGGAESVRQPQFRTVQSMHNANFRALSVLDTPNIIPNSNGLGTADHERRVMGRTDPVSGRSKDTFDQQMWLHHQVSRRQYDQPQES